MQRLAVVGSVENRMWMEQIIKSGRVWEYAGHFDPKIKTAFLPESKEGIQMTFESFVTRNDSIFFMNNQALPFGEIEFSLKNSKNIFIENLYSLDWISLQRLHKLLSELRSTCMAGTISNLQVHEWSEILPPAPPRIIQIERGMELHPDNLKVVLAECVEIIIQLVQAECRRTDAISIKTVNQKFDTLEASIKFSNASVANILIHPPYPKNEYRLAVYQNNGLLTADLVNKTLFALVNQDEYADTLIELSRENKIKYYLETFYNTMHKLPSSLQIMDRITPMEILHTLLNKIKHISVTHI